MEKEKNKKILFSYNGIEIYKEHEEDEEDGFVSFMDIHSLATKGDNATVTMEEVQKLVKMLEDGTSLPKEYAICFMLSLICIFLNKHDNVEAAFISRGTYLDLPEEDKEEWYSFDGTSFSNFFVRVRCKEWGV